MGIPLGPINPSDPALEVYRNLRGKPRANWFVKLMGQKQVISEKGVTVTSFLWRGQEHIEKIEYLGIYSD